MIDFSEKTYTNILDLQMQRISDTIDKREGSIIQTALAPSSWYLEGAYMDLKHVYDNAFVLSAVGESLDKIGTMFGLERKKAKAVVKKGIFDAEVPLGFRAASLLKNPYLVYKAVKYIGIENKCYEYEMECETVGIIGNSYSGKLLPIDSVSSLTLAEITSIIEEGSEEETDENFRIRILVKARMPSTSGNKYDYYNWAMEVAGVGAAKVFPLADGPGTVKVAIADAGMSAAEPALVAAVAEHIEEKRPIGADVTVVSAVEKAVNVSAKARLQTGNDLDAVQTAFRAVMGEYLKSNAFHISYVSAARVGSLLLSVTGVEDYSELLLNGIDKNVPLTDLEIAVVGNVVIELEVE